MGNPLLDGAEAHADAAIIHTFYSDKSWIEGAAVDQLNHVAGYSGVQSIAAFPDLHPGKYGPVGCAILAERLYPQLIGNDIGCGMSLFALDIPARKLRIDKAAQKLRALEGQWDGDAAKRLQASDLPTNLHPETLGTIGGGNHFCEVQAVGDLFDPIAARRIGLTKDTTMLLVHSGSRSLGMEVFSDVLHLVKAVDSDTTDAKTYMHRHHQAVAWARLNRQIIAERAANALRASCKLIADSPHNLIEELDGGYLHRKGAAKADIPFVPLAGSRDSLSYLLEPVGSNNAALASLAHGSGRRYDRRSMLGRIGDKKSDREKLARTSFGGVVICEDKQLLIEEAPQAYKNSEQVLDDLVGAGLASCVASFKPLITFKKASHERKSAAREKQRKLTQRRRDR